MATIEEDYVSYEVAKLLKEKGFLANDRIYKVYHLKDKSLINSDGNFNYDTEIPTPTLQMAMKWLRRYGWVICIIPLTFCCGEGISEWGCCVWKDDNLEIDEDDTPRYNTYEQACESAIKYCLEYL